jgi:hypothetical protein
MSMFANIMPTPLLWTFGNQPYHMILPSECGDQRYFNFYRNALGYKILDNGAAEGEQLSNDELLYYARAMSVDEVVIPDVMGDAKATTEKAFDFLRFVQDVQVIGDFNWMFCLHGTTMEEIEASLSATQFLPFITTYALPRILASTMDDAEIRIKLSHNERVRHKRIHWLGAHSYIDEVLRMPTWVGGIDTSMPMSLARAGLDIEKDYNTIEAKTLKRGEGFFDWDPQPQSPEFFLAAHNCTVYSEWVR